MLVEQKSQRNSRNWNNTDKEIIGKGASNRQEIRDPENCATTTISLGVNFQKGEFLKDKNQGIKSRAFKKGKTGTKTMNAWWIRLGQGPLWGWKSITYWAWIRQHCLSKWSSNELPRFELASFFNWGWHFDGGWLGDNAGNQNDPPFIGTISRAIENKKFRNPISSRTDQCELEIGNKLENDLTMKEYSTKKNHGLGSSHVKDDPTMSSGSPILILPSMILWSKWWNSIERSLIWGDIQLLFSKTMGYLKIPVPTRVLSLLEKVKEFWSQKGGVHEAKCAIVRSGNAINKIIRDCGGRFKNSVNVKVPLLDSMNSMAKLVTPKTRHRHRLGF